MRLLTETQGHCGKAIFSVSALNLSRQLPCQLPAIFDGKQTAGRHAMQISASPGLQEEAVGRFLIVLVRIIRFLGIRA